MAMTEIRIEGLRYSEGIYEQLSDIKGLLEQRINLNEYTGNVRPISLPLTTVMRTCMLVGLCDNKDRNIEEMKSVELAKNRQPLQASFFTKLKLKRTLSVLIKLRYYGKGLDLNDSVIMSKLIGYEMLRGRKLLMQDGKKRKETKRTERNRLFLRKRRKCSAQIFERKDSRGEK